MQKVKGGIGTEQEPPEQELTLLVHSMHQCQVM